MNEPSFEHVYEEQIEYMREFKKSLDSTGEEGHAMIEMPTGTGKTMCILALVLAYQQANPTIGIFWCWWSSYWWNPRVSDLLHKNNSWNESMHERIEKTNEISSEGVGKRVQAHSRILHDLQKESVH